MKKFLILLIILSGLGSAGYYYGSIYWEKHEFNQIVKPMYVDIVKNEWDKRTVEKYAADDMNAWLATKESDVMLKAFADLGKIQKYKGVIKVKQSVENEQESALLRVIIVFEKGPHEIVTGLVKQEGKWMLTGFKIKTYQLND